MTEQQRNMRNCVQAPARVVTLFEDRAEVQRVATLRLRSGVQVVTLLGVSVFVDDLSVVVKPLQGEVACEAVSVVATRVVREAVEQANEDEAEVERLKNKLRDVQERCDAIDNEVTRLRSHASRIESLMQMWDKALSAMPSGFHTDEGTCESSEELWKSSFKNLQNELKRTYDAIADKKTQRYHATRLRDRAHQLVDVAERTTHHYRAGVEVQLYVADEAVHEGEEERTVQLELTYRTACALWRPEHMATLITADDGTHQLALQTLATVWQITGEKWENVTCKFSTARPAQQASAPMLQSDLLTMRKKSDQERKQIVVHQRDEQIATVGISDGVRVVQQMPGLDDGGQAFAYVAPEPCTIVSDGAPVRVKLYEQVLSCDVQHVAYPELSEVVHVRATATLGKGMPLLAGPLWIARQNAIMGRSQTQFVAEGEAFELGMGVDDGLRVRRTATEKRETVPVLGTQIIRYDVELFVSNLSDESRSLRVVERVAVSELQDVKVLVTSHEGGKLNERDGMVVFDVNLPPGALHILVLRYRIEAGARVVI